MNSPLTHVFIFLTIFNGMNSDIDLDTQYGDLVFSSVIFRHGSRTPLMIYPLNPYNESFWPQGLNQLTNKGKLEGYELGIWLRKRYIKLLGDTYNTKTIYTMSAELDKSMMTAECFLAGLYPPSESEIWTPNINWQPIPVHSITSIIDNILSTTKPCEMLEYQQLLLNDVPYYQEFYKENIPLMEIVTKNTGVYFNPNRIYDSITDMAYIYDSINIQEDNNLTAAPAWTKNILPSMQNFALEHFSIPFYNLESQRLRVGPFLKLVIHNMTNKVEGTLQPSRTLAVYSAREANLVGILTVLGLYTVPPSPTSCLMIELRKLNNSYNVVILYKNSTDDVNVMEIPECPSPCSLQKFIEFTNTFIPQDWDAECALTTNEYADITILGVFAVAGTVLIIVSLFYCCIRTLRASNRKIKYENI